MRRLLLAAALVGFAGSANASLSSTWTLASDYLFDGVSQTYDDPALQISLDWSNDYGIYAGLWASNVDFGPGDPANVEVDLYGGVTKSYDSGWGWTAGFASYYYTGAPSDYDYTEVTGGVTFPTGTTLQAWGADDELLDGRLLRYKVKHGFDLGNDFTLLLEATRTTYESDSFKDFTHGQIGVSHPLGPFTAYLGYSDTDSKLLDGDDTSPTFGRFLENERGDGRVLFTLSYTFTLIE